MNSLSFTFFRLISSLGIINTQERFRIVTRESILLSEAELILGEAVAGEVEGIRELSEEYWQIKSIEAQEEKLEVELEEAEMEREWLEAKKNELDQLLDQEISQISQLRNELMSEMMARRTEMSAARHQAELASGQFNGAKMKYQVLSDEGADESALISASEEIDRFQVAFLESKEKLEAISVRAKESEKQMEELESKVEAKKAAVADEKKKIVTEVGHASNRVAKISASLGALQRKKRDYFYTIGNFLCANCDSRDQDISSILSNYGALISKVRSIKKSIRYNRLLAGRDDEV